MKRSAMPRPHGAATALAQNREDRLTLALLSLPILAIILSLGLTQAMKQPALVRIAASPAQPTTATPAAAARRTPLAAASQPLEIRSVSSAPVTETTPPLLVDARRPDAIPTRPAPVTADDPSRQIAMLAPAAPIDVRPAPHPSTGPITREAPDATPTEACLMPAPAVPSSAAQSVTPAMFGTLLADAAGAQARDFVLYTDTYRSLPYPRGDVHPLYGVCTDVVIRAYRALGIDLQKLVHESRIGSGDTNIDHRRTETLRRFLARQGESLPVTPFAEDYLPGDIVTYERPQNRHSRSHIAIVSAVLAPSGRYMIVHNRGWGPQLEDGLFVDAMTGHYRYRGPIAAPVVAMTPAPLATPQKRPTVLSRLAAGSRAVGAPSRRDGEVAAGLGH